MLNVVLVEPEIPQNCGNIARTCAATGCRLHLIRPLGFDISEKAVKRAGLDYWNLVEVLDYENLEDFFARNQVTEMWRPEARSLNLSNAVAVTVSEALRQLSFPHLKDFGKMRG